MMVAVYPTKKKLKESVGKVLNYREVEVVNPSEWLWVPVSVTEQKFTTDGRIVVVGPNEYNRKWYAEVTMEHGLIKRVK